MTPESSRRRANRYERKRQRLGSPNPACVVCGYNHEPSLVEAHHIAGAANDPNLVAALCRNHHGELSDAAEDSLGDLRRRDAQRDPFTKLAAMMKGLADFLRLLAEQLDEWAKWLLLAAAELLEWLGQGWWLRVSFKAPI